MIEILSEINKLIPAGMSWDDDRITVAGIGLVVHDVTGNVMTPDSITNWAGLSFREGHRRMSFDEVKNLNSSGDLLAVVIPQIEELQKNFHH